MSLHDCPNCWDTPCTCGHEWQKQSSDNLHEHITVLVKVLKEREGKSLEQVLTDIKNNCNGQGVF